MKKIMLIMCVLFFCIASFVICGEPEVEVVEPVAEVAEAVVETAPEVPKGPSIGQSIWLFLNSSVGISIVGSILVFILGKIFTAKPKWKKYVLKYGPSLMKAVKQAEKAIPDNTENKALGRLDKALEYLLDLEPKLAQAASGELKKAISAVHTSAEANGNLKKG